MEAKESLKQNSIRKAGTGALESGKMTVREMTIFGVLGGLMFASKEIMAALPNIHLIGTLIVAMTVVYRRKALYPIYTFVLLDGLVWGFNTWWIPYLYIWTVLWGAVMLLPKDLIERTKYAPLIYMAVCSLHGFLYGTLYAPFQALVFGMNFKATVAWIITGLPFDAIHGVSNFVCGSLIIPIVKAIRLADRASRR